MDDEFETEMLKMLEGIGNEDENIWQVKEKCHRIIRKLNL